MYNHTVRRILERRFAVNKLIMKYGGMLAALALVVTTLTANSACIFYTHQEQLPESAKALRKF